MKRILLLLIATATLGLASCKKDNIIQETSNRTILITIQPSQWKLTTDGRTYNAEIGIDEIDDLSVRLEGILVYREHPVNPESYIQIPYTFEGNTYSYEQFDGGLSFDIQRATFATGSPIAPTVPIRFKVVLIPSRNVT